jgi:hypothetical protein
MDLMLLSISEQISSNVFFKKLTSLEKAGLSQCGNNSSYTFLAAYL